MQSRPADRIRDALRRLPRGTTHGEPVSARSVYAPPSHVHALHPDALLVTGMRGAGKTFWWSALQDAEVRELLAKSLSSPVSADTTVVSAGFGVRPQPTHYPSKDALRAMIGDRIEPRIAWRTVLAFQLARDRPSPEAPFPETTSHGTWKDRASYVMSNPEEIDEFLARTDQCFDEEDKYYLMLFDALDRCADDWKGMHSMIRGLLQLAVEVQPYRRLRVKMFLRSDQLVEGKTVDVPDVSKVLASRVDLSWPRRELYGLLWHCLAHDENVEALEGVLGVSKWTSMPIGGDSIAVVPRRLRQEEDQRLAFHAMAGDWMGTDRRRGFPYTWIFNHLADADGQVSPRSFLAAIRKAADDTAERYPEHDKALHYNSIKRGVQEASSIRVNELREDYPWVDRLLQPLRGQVVPCEFDDIVGAWETEGVLASLQESISDDDVKLPPSRLSEGPNGVRQDLETLGVFQPMRDRRVNIPDVFRVGYGLGRKGGVRPVGRRNRSSGGQRNLF